jgi:hypothetical protein
LEANGNEKVTKSMRFIFLLLICCLCSNFVLAQNDPNEVEEDYSIYENLVFSDTSAKRFCTPKVFDLSPAKLIWLGYDFQGPFHVDYGKSPSDSSTNNSGQFNSTRGSRIGLNIPIISRTNFVWQMGCNHNRTEFTGSESVPYSLDSTLRENGLTTFGLNTTLFKPLDAQRFFLAQASADLSGDFRFQNITPSKYIRYSAALIYGKKPHDRCMIGFGISRTYRVGELNFIPVFLLNWTSPSRKWGIEMLAPARAHVRKTLSARNILLFGYELEGNSYRILRNRDINPLGYELRRGELRFRAVWETSMYSFIWMSVQAGYRVGYSFNVDDFGSNDREFFRGFFGNQPYFQENKYAGSWYAQLSINLVSP